MKGEKPASEADPLVLSDSSLLPGQCPSGRWSTKREVFSAGGMGHAEPGLWKPVRDVNIAK